MPVLHMETDQVREIGRQLGRAAENLLHESDNLRRSVQTLSANWQGSSAEIFVGEANDNLSQLQQFGRLGDELNLRLQREVDEWEQVDAGIALSGVIIGSPSLFVDIGRFISGPAFSPFSIEEATEYLNQSPAGQALIQEAKEKGLGFRLPNGQVIGDANGRFVEIQFADTDGNFGLFSADPDGNPTTDDGRIDITDSFWRRARLEEKQLAAILAHEMQHALDHQDGILDQSLNPPPGADSHEVDQILTSFVERHAASEARAFARYEAVWQGGSYVDDGVLSPDEIRNVLVDKDYESFYEEKFNAMFDNSGGQYEVDVVVTPDGRIDVVVYQSGVDFVPLPPNYA